MMFDFHSVPRIVFGRGQFARAGELAATLGDNALIVSSASAARAGLTERLGEMLQQAGVAGTVVEQVGEPQVDDVDRALATARREACTLAIGLGGGSAIDAAKAVAGLVANGGRAGDYMEVVGLGKKITRPAIPWIAIPTTAGTGAEVTRNAVIGWKEKNFKASIRSEHLLARVAIVDPELGVGVPPDVTARCGMDALCQLIESYTSTNANPMTDGLALQGTYLAGWALRAAYARPADLDAREAMALAALLSGITLTNAGLGAVHGLAAPLGAKLPIPHGTVCAALLGPVIRANLAELRRRTTDAAAKHSLARYATIGRTLSGRADLDESAAGEAGAEFCDSLARDLHIPPLGTLGLDEATADEVAQLAQKSSSMRYNPVPLSAATLKGVLLQAM
ncbi:MAG: Alcohol dehydrogenase [Planctomycetes bacterium ADurb.Bin126]|nr:MAG: Alcohol dehydrogenase [Planctomycetes bacterium ADurb.Bin126]HOD81109.1 iron-containing alcohol dehydrogenase [Phycisphaerae bacterium]HQL72632.1 iron-containing alcohol dehydrogenase [Phycisphaerae bacterium]